jgi:hypothetical protein
MNKEHKVLIERLERIFPKMEMCFSTTLFNDEKECSPEYTITWCDFLEELKKNGLEIKNSIK